VKSFPEIVDPAVDRSTCHRAGLAPVGRIGLRSSRKQGPMRYMVIVKASDESESGRMPTQQELAEMGTYNEELVKAGVMLAGEGLLPSSKGARVRFDKDGRTTVIDGPFTETKELVAGFWILQVSSREEVLEWVKKAPFRDAEIEVRKVAEAEDFGDELTPELREKEDQLRATVEAQQKS